jgi:CheY-like chemotaxis protein
MISADEVERHLAVGHAVVLLPDPPRDDGYRERLFLRGWQRGNYLLLETELSGDSRSIYRKGSPCSLRFVSDGYACVCQSVVQDLGTGSHFSYMRVKWPASFSSVPVRRYERVRVQMPCEISDGSQTITGELADMSVGGCRILSDAALPVDSDCKLSCTLPDGADISGLSIAICNCTRSGKRYTLGCTFSDRDEMAWHDVEFYVATTLTRLRGESSDNSSVLILESDPQKIQTTRHMLERAGYDIAITQSAVDAFFMLRMNSPELLLVNQVVPDMDVATFCTTMRSSRRFEELPMIVYGGEQSNAQAALDAGANHHVAELSPTPELIDLVKRYANKEETQRSAIQV